MIKGLLLLLLKSVEFDDDVALIKGQGKDNLD